MSLRQLWRHRPAPSARRPSLRPATPTPPLRALSSAPAANPALYGTDEPPLPPPELLSYGGLEVEVVPNVGVGSVKYGGAEICRGINFLFRDEGWGTPPLELESSLIARPDGEDAASTVSWTSSPST
eukprot:COSAG04_NODE_10621_length_763_cov_1.381024_1_plen_126_part_10